MKPWRAWLIFLCCLLALAGAMAFTTHVLQQIDAERARAARERAEQDAIRAALWQMDAEVSSLVADEAARPYFEYFAFYPANAAYTRMFREIERGEVLVPSPLLAYQGAFIDVHFQVKPDGTFTSPQAPAGNMRDLAESRYLSRDQVEARAAQLEQVSRALSGANLRDKLPRRKPHDSKLPSELVFADSAWAAQNVQNRDEYNKRADAARKAAERKKDMATQFPNYNNDQTDWQADHAAVIEHPMTALWVGEELFLARLVTLDQADYVQGCRLNWSGVRDALATSARDTLPGPSFAPAAGADTALEQRLASLPVKVVPGLVNTNVEQTASPVRVALWVAWGAVLMAALAVGLVLRSTVSLSERRADFVSAVTHELRTPLTTLRMYAELLSTGRVKDDAARGDYLNTMHAEAVRLSHLIENVLSYARLERGKPSERVETVRAAELMQRAQKTLEERAKQGRMTLEVSLAPDLENAVVRADPAAIERILFNLVDNACKYAGSAADKRVEVSATAAGGQVAFRVRDHGPGIGAEAAARLFKPFRKSAQAAANSAPGVGLGLSLCRALARAMGGELRHRAEVVPGACFELELPAAG